MLRRVVNLSRKLCQTQTRYFSDNFMQSNNTIYIEQMYQVWAKDPSAVHSSWNSYFTNISKGMDSKDAFIHPDQIKGQVNLQTAPQVQQNQVTWIMDDMINQFRKYGHYMADVDPLRMEDSRPRFEEETKFYNLEDWGIPSDKLDEPVVYDNRLRESFTKEKAEWTPRQLHARLKEIYCDKISFEFMHIPSREVSDWIRKRIESPNRAVKTKEQKLDLFDRIMESQAFTLYLEKRFSTAKRFGCEGLDVAISALDRVRQVAVDKKFKDIIIGMAHRGRLNTLCAVMKKPYEQIFAEFEQVKPAKRQVEISGFSGDVKYHLGASNVIKYGDNEELRMVLLPNPSHLEAVNPVVLGVAKARQDLNPNDDKTNVLPIIIHGDAALAGQGIVYETQQLEKVDNFDVGGALHLVLNNQIGFTTDMKNARSGHYCTNIAQMNKNFTIHVNADEPELVDFAMELAVEFRTEFKRDVYVDITGYRKFGHNEQDTPSFTQPKMYNLVNKQKPMYLQYKDRLIAEGVLTEEEYENKLNYYTAQLEKQHELSKTGQFKLFDWDSHTYNTLVSKNDGRTFVTKDRLQNVASKIFSLDDSVKPHKALKKLYKDRLASVTNETEIDWASAELLAYGTLLDEGYNIRLTGEDVERGTFTHRQAVITDQENGSKYVPMRNLLAGQNPNRFVISNSILSEYAVLGYEYGYSLANPQNLTLWEAQFGDFSNGAQIMIDQFITSAEKKWEKFSGLTMLLPHGYDGAGPEHSNAHLERYLSFVDDDYLYLEKNPEFREGITKKSNMLVCSLTSASNYFHLLRSQVKRDFRKPLAVMVSKRLLMSKQVRAPISEFLQPNEFQTVINDSMDDKSNVRKVLVCSGQVYFDLLEKRKNLGLENEVAIIRLERIGPFPYKSFKKAITDYKRNAHVTFVQEEHLNFGAWSYVQPRMDLVLRENGFNHSDVAAREISSSTATGYPLVSKKQLERLLKDAFSA